MKYDLLSGSRKIIELTDKNNYIKAEKLCLSLLKTNRKEANLWILLIDLFLKSGNYSKIVRNKSEIKKVFPATHPVHNTLAECFRQYGYYDLAIDEYRIITSSGKGDLNHYLNHAALLFHTRQYNAAINLLDGAMKLFTPTSKLHLMLGASYHSQQNLDAALLNYTTAYNLDKENNDTITGIANIYFLRRDYDKAISVLEPVIKAEPPVSAIILYCQICTEKKYYDPALLLIQKTLTNKNIATTQQAMLYFTAGKINDALGNFDHAFIDYKKGNDLVNPGFDYLNHKHYFEKIKKIFTRAFIRKNQIESKSKRLIFIVGMPRSGTSLVEQILASHPDIYGAGELNILNDIVKQFPQKNNNKKAPYPEGITHLSNNALNTMAEYYLQYIIQLDADKDHVTDKMPDNFQYLGLINLLFPHAKIIHCRRNALDTCLSCYFQQFSGDYPYSYNLQNLGSYYTLYKDLMNYWSDTLTISIHDIDYETLTATPENTIRELLNFCDVTWDESCLYFHQSERTVSTASSHQINQPLYTKSVYRWKKYQTHIYDLINMIENIDTPYRLPVSDDGLN